jgi:hypothetical protein
MMAMVRAAVDVINADSDNILVTPFARNVVSVMSKPNIAIVPRITESEV